MSCGAALLRVMLVAGMGLLMSSRAGALATSGFDPALSLRVTPGTGLLDLVGVHLNYAPERWSLDVGVGGGPLSQTSLRAHIAAALMAYEGETRAGRTRRRSFGPYLGLVRSWSPWYGGDYSIGEYPVFADRDKPRILEGEAGLDFGVQTTTLAWRTEHLATTVGLSLGASAFPDPDYWELAPDLRLDFGVALRLPRR